MLVCLLFLPCMWMPTRMLASFFAVVCGFDGTSELMALVSTLFEALSPASCLMIHGVNLFP